MYKVFYASLLTEQVHAFMCYSFDVIFCDDLLVEELNIIKTM